MLFSGMIAFRRSDADQQVISCKKPLMREAPPLGKGDLSVGVLDCPKAIILLAGSGCMDAASLQSLCSSYGTSSVSCCCMGKLCASSQYDLTWAVLQCRLVVKSCWASFLVCITNNSASSSCLLSSLLWSWCMVFRGSSFQFRCICNV